MARSETRYAQTADRFIHIFIANFGVEWTGTPSDEYLIASRYGQRVNDSSHEISSSEAVTQAARDHEPCEKADNEKHYNRNHNCDEYLFQARPLSKHVHAEHRHEYRAGDKRRSQSAVEVTSNGEYVHTVNADREENESSNDRECGEGCCAGCRRAKCKRDGEPQAAGTDERDHGQNDVGAHNSYDVTVWL